jgi:hypothetical protein
MKIAMLDVHNVGYANIFSIAQPLKEAYCKRHGYDFLVYNTDRPLIPANRQDNWGRCQGILYHLKEYDWLFYLDTDILIMNPDHRIEDWIDDNYNLIAGPLPEEGHIMTSGMLIKNCRWSFEFFLDMYAQTRFIEDRYHSPKEGPHATGIPCTGGLYWEQSSFHFLYDTEEKYRSKIKLVPRECFNSETCSYKDGDFLIHFPGQGPAKIPLMKTMLSKGREEMLKIRNPVSISDIPAVMEEQRLRVKRLKPRFIGK